MFGKIVGALVGGLASLSVSHATVLITVDIADPSAVVFTGTGASADIDFSAPEFTGSAGIILRNILMTGAGAASGTDPSSTLANGSSAVFFTGGVASGGAPTIGNVTNRDFNLFDSGNSSALSFSTTLPAFTGSATINFASIASNFEVVGFVGDILLGDFQTTSTGLGPVIGQFQIIDSSEIPVPAAALLFMSGAGLVFFRRKG